MGAYFESPWVQLYRTDACALPLADEAVDCVVTSPPYWRLRDYSLEPTVWGGEDHEHEWGDWQETHDEREITMAGKSRTTDRQKHIAGAFCARCGTWRGNLGLEPTPELYVEHLVGVFREVRRVLKPTGTCWLNLGDCYASQGGYRDYGSYDNYVGRGSTGGQRPVVGNGIKAKDLVMMPARVALALQADGWWLRSDIIWSKPNPMPESVTDRPTTAHEHLFLLAKQAVYYYDAEAIREPNSPDTHPYAKGGSFDRPGEAWPTWGISGTQSLRGVNRATYRNPAGRNKRTVWEIPTQPYPEAHFATFPEALVEPCILAGTSERGVCATCGKPWERVLVKRSSTMNIRVRDAKKGVLSSKSGIDGLYQATDAEVAAYGPELEGDTRTTGWRPTCGHEAAPVPATVLDPFVGSGTTCVVAQKLGRHAIGTDMSAEYLEVAADRLTAITLPLGLGA